MKNTFLTIVRALLISALMLGGMPPARAARTFNGTSDYLIATAPAGLAEPLTIACWFRLGDITTPKALVSISTAGGTARWQLVENTGSAQPLRADSIDSAGNFVYASAATPLSVGTWYHGAAVFASSTSRTIYLDGGGAVTNTTASTVTGTNRLLVGARIASGLVGGFANAQIAEVGIWSAALTPAEIASLAAGFSPEKIRPGSLVSYLPLIGDTIDRQGNVWTATGTSATTHPRVYFR